MIRRLSFPEDGRRYLSQVSGADPTDTAEGQPGCRGDAAPQEVVALAHALYLLGPLPVDPPCAVRGACVSPLLAPAPLAYVPGQGRAAFPRRRWPDAASPGPWRCPDRRTPEGRRSRRCSHPASPAVPKPRSAIGPSGPALPPSLSLPIGGRPSGESVPAGSRRPRCLCPRRPARSRPNSGAGSPGCWRRLPWLPTRGRIRTVIRSSLTGPRFWHGSLMLRRADFWLCSHLSLSGRDDQAAGPELRPP